MPSVVLPLLHSPFFVFFIFFCVFFLFTDRLTALSQTLCLFLIYLVAVMRLRFQSLDRLIRSLRPMARATLKSAKNYKQARFRIRPAASQAVRALENTERSDRELVQLVRPQIFLGEDPGPNPASVFFCF
jgi:hypothetical protein